jgi:hypothetical protein
MSDQQQELEHPSTPHGKPEEGMCCLCTMEDITEKDGNYVEYQSFPSMVWKPAFFEKEIVQQVSSWILVATVASSLSQAAFFSAF